MTMHAPQSDRPIVFDNVRVKAGAVTIIDGLTLRVASGAPTVVIGPNGSGKTTLLKLAMGLILPSHGRVTWGGVDFASPEHRAFVFQRPAMLRRSVEGNLRFALRAAGVPRSYMECRVQELLNLVGLAHLARRPARRLSGGEQQRLALARAMARDPKLLLLDEPTASLDPAATKAIEDLILSLSRRGIKVMMSTHDIGQARRLAGDVVVLHRGRIIEADRAERIFTTPRSDDTRKFIAGELLI